MNDSENRRGRVGNRTGKGRGGDGGRMEKEGGRLWVTDSVDSEDRWGRGQEGQNREMARKRGDRRSKQEGEKKATEKRVWRYIIEATEQRGERERRT